MIPIDEYERLKSLDEENERKEIFHTIQARKNTSQSEYVSFDDAMKTAGL